SSLVWTQVKFWERGLPKPKNVTFVPLDLDHDPLAQRLHEFGFTQDQPASFSALGLSQYLERHSNEALFRLVASMPQGSEIVFSYLPHHTELPEGDRQFL